MRCGNDASIINAGLASAVDSDSENNNIAEQGLYCRLRGRKRNGGDVRKHEGPRRAQIDLVTAGGVLYSTTRRRDRPSMICYCTAPSRFSVMALSPSIARSGVDAAVASVTSARSTSHKEGRSYGVGDDGVAVVATFSAVV